MRSNPEIESVRSHVINSVVDRNSETLGGKLHHPHRLLRHLAKRDILSFSERECHACLLLGLTANSPHPCSPSPPGSFEDASRVMAETSKGTRSRVDVGPDAQRSVGGFHARQDLSKVPGNPSETQNTHAGYTLDGS